MMLIVKLTRAEAAMVAAEISRSDVYTVRVAFDLTDKAFKVKVNEGVWSPPIGEPQ